MKKYLFFTCCLFLAALILSSNVLAESETEDYTYGTFVRSSDAELVISEYDFESGEDAERTYKISPNIKLRGLGAISDLQPGDYVELSFIPKGSTLEVLSILVEKILEEEPEPAA